MEQIKWMEQKHDTTMLHNEPKNDFVIQSVNNASHPSRFSPHQQLQYKALQTRVPSPVAAMLDCLRTNNIPIRIMLFAHGKN